jgi:hypothetical protein
MKMLAIAVVAVMSGLLELGCKPAPPEDNRPETIARRAFAVDLPSGCTLDGGKRTTDFAVFQVVCARVPVVGIYAGNAPSIDQQREGLALRADIPKRSAIVAIADPDERVRGYLWETDYRWPSQLHIWLVKDHENDDLARRIAASVHPVSPTP